MHWLSDQLWQFHFTSFYFIQFTCQFQITEDCTRWLPTYTINSAATHANMSCHQSINLNVEVLPQTLADRLRSLAEVSLRHEENRNAELCLITTKKKTSMPSAKNRLFYYYHKKRRFAPDLTWRLVPFAQTSKQWKRMSSLELTTANALRAGVSLPLHCLASASRFVSDTHVSVYNHSDRLWCLSLRTYARTLVPHVVFC